MGIQRAPSFQQDIRPMFTEYDRDQMRFAFDLWSYNDVKDHADQILTRLQRAEMPCDQQWSEQQILLFRDWLQSGMLS